MQTTSAMIQKNWHLWKYCVHYKFRSKGQHDSHHSLSPSWLFVTNGKILEMLEKYIVHTFFSASCWFSCYFISSAYPVSQSVNEFDELPVLGITKRCWQWISTSHIRFLADLIWGHPVLVLWVANSPWETTCAGWSYLWKTRVPQCLGCVCTQEEPDGWSCGFALASPCRRNTWDGCCQVSVWLLCATSCSGSSLRGVFKA